jgi:hypothetical protein
MRTSLAGAWIPARSPWPVRLLATAGSRAASHRRPHRRTPVRPSSCSPICPLARSLLLLHLASARTDDVIAALTATIAGLPAPLHRTSPGTRASR